MIILGHIVDGITYIIEIMPIMGMVRCGRILTDSGKCIATFSAMPMPKHLTFRREHSELTFAQVCGITEQIRPVLIPPLFGNPA